MSHISVIPGPGSGVVLFLEGDNPVAVGPDGTGVIHVIGSPGVTVTGNAGAHTLTIATLGVQAIVTTNDATPTTIYTVPVPIGGQGVLITVNVIATEAAYAGMVSGVVYGSARNAGAGAIIAGAEVPILMTDIAGPPTVTFNAVGNNIQVVVVGVAATTINWKAFINTITN